MAQGLLTAGLHGSGSSDNVWLSTVIVPPLAQLSRYQSLKKQLPPHLIPFTRMLSRSSVQPVHTLKDQKNSKSTCRDIKQSVIDDCNDPQTDKV